MKKGLKILGIVVLSLLLIAAIAAATIKFQPIPSYPVEKIVFQHTASPEALERGKKLTSMLCAGCHINQETGRLSGKLMNDAPPAFGEIHSPNITRHKTAGIGDWTDGELVYLLRTGIKKDGQYAPAYMAKLPHLADEDMNAIIAFLRSDDPLVQPDATPSVPSKPGMLTKFLCKVAWKPYPMPSNTISMPDTTDVLAVGKYLAFNLECFSCHSESFETNDYLHPENSKGYCGGGNTMLTPEGKDIVTANITSDPETGIGKWTRAEFIKTLKYGIKEGAPAMQLPMQPYTALSDREAGAIYDYLMSIPAISNEVERTVY